MVYPHRRPWTRIMLIVGIVISLAFAVSLLHPPEPEYLSPIPVASVDAQDRPPVLKDTGQGLIDTVETALADSTGTYAVVIKNLKTGVTYSRNEHDVYSAGSLYKLWVMATVYRKIQQGTIKADEVVTSDIAALNEKYKIATEAAELTEGTVTFTISSAVKQMITISHNYAALMLTKRVGIAAIDSFLKDHAFHESSIVTQNSTPLTTAHDIALFFEKLYIGELGNRETTAAMMEHLKGQERKNKLAKYLPEGTVMAHKTGEIDYFTHDAGIVLLPENEYIIVVLSQSDFPLGAAERIALVSQAVYEYFAKKNS